MAWLCGGRTNNDLVSNLKNAGLLTSSRIAQAMLKTDRKHYVPEPSHAYEDSPQTIGFNATISAPHMHAHALSNLEPFLGEGSKVLDVGCGSGYLTGVLAHLVGPTGKVVGIDHIRGLVDQSISNLSKDGFQIDNEGNASGLKVVLGDGRKGWKDEAPYDAIHVGAAAPFMPQDLIDQLKAPGRMFIPVGTSFQSIWQVDKKENGDVVKEELFGVRYVPLTDASRQWRED